MKNKTVWLIGASQMAIEYVKVLRSLNIAPEVIGRGSESAEKFHLQTGIMPFVGGLDKYLDSSDKIPDYAIVSVGVGQLAHVAVLLIDYGVKHILLEKPGGCNSTEIFLVKDHAETHGSKVYIAYNRRFYSSVLHAEDIIEEDGGLLSFNFEFTEWSHIISALPTPEKVKENWFLANSTHVVDTAFFIGGNPVDMKCFSGGALSWHKPSTFSGAGITAKGALFSYGSNWEAPGRWSIEFLTRHHRLYLRPMEKLFIQSIGSVNLDEVNLRNTLDLDYKPGIYLQVESFLQDKTSRLCTIAEQYEHVMQHYNKILGR